MECINPENDGIDHINVYSKGKTRLGRLLSNFAWTPFNHPQYGHFKTVEGFWYWIITENEKLRYLSGYECKKLGKTLEPKRGEPTKKELTIVYKCKLDFNPELFDLLKENKLPLKHYYIYGNKVIIPDNYLWTAELWNEIINGN